MKWFGGSRRRRLRNEAGFWIDAIANCALHPMYLDDEAVQSARLDVAYVDFAGALYDFQSAVEMEFAAKDIGGLRKDFIEGQWSVHLAAGDPDNPMLRVVRVHTDRLIDTLERL
ncbi:hypothetical protein [Arthrobacter celericrescens]|uniref:hypothetical protein n=1 Tax=Arthrobacter celericrescens TaxID=2320851 RepID=UPI0013C407EF|nr:hypothetical protein [Arthrobacter celericrescens]